MEVLDFVRMHLMAWPPLAKAAVALALIVGVPPLSKRVRIPGVIGLLLAGVAIGPHGLGLISERHPIADFFADVGKLLLMFFAAQLNSTSRWVASFSMNGNKSSYNQTP